MRFISTKTHGYMDYIIGALLVIAPWLFGFAAGGAETIIPVVLGLAIVGGALFTDNEVALSRQIPMSSHLTFDIIGGIFLGISPFIFGFSGMVWVPHVLVGAVLLFSGLYTSRMPAYCPKGAPCYKYAHSHH